MTGKWTDNRISVALIGAGKMGEKWAEAVSTHPKTRLSIVIDNDFFKAEYLARKYHTTFGRYYHNLIAYEAYEKTEFSGIAIKADAAVIALPNQFAADAAYAVLGMGKHVLAEKPTARNTEELEGVIRTAKEKNLVFMPGYNFRHLGHIARAKELVDSGAIGKIMFIRGTHGASGRPGYEKEWRHKKSSGGGVLLDLSVHMIDLVRWFAGDIIKAEGIAKNMFWNSEVEDNAFLHLETASGVVASLHSGWTEWKPKFRFEIFGDQGYIIAEGLKNYLQEERLIVGKRSSDFLGSKTKEETLVFQNDITMSLVMELDEFVSAIEEGREYRPNGQDAMEVLKIVSSL